MAASLTTWQSVLLRRGPQRRNVGEPVGVGAAPLPPSRSSRRQILARGTAAIAGATGVASFLAACGASATGSGGGQSTKSEYVVAPLQGAYGNLATDISRGQQLAEFLARETGLAVKGFPPGDYTRSMIGLADGSIDLAFLPAVLFLRARDENGVEPLFRTLRPGADGKPTPIFTGIVAVRPESGLNSINDLKGKQIIAADPSDAAGWVLPAAQLKKAGLDLKRDVTVNYANNGADALVQLLNKKADAAFAARHDLTDAAVAKVDPNAAQSLKLLSSIEGAPLEVVVARKGLDAKVLDKLKNALKVLNDPQKGTFTKDGKTQPILGQWGVSSLVETRDTDFATLREAAKSIGVKLK